MSYTIEKSSKYLKAEDELKKILGFKAFEKMEKRLRENPFNSPKHITKLIDYEPPYRYRIGDYRVFYDISEDSNTVILHYIKKRGQAYKKR